MADHVIIPLDKLKVGDVALRPADTGSESFKNLQKSIDKEGILQSILVRPDEEEGFYFLIDGLQRVTCAKNLGHTTIPALIQDADELQLMRYQIQTNLHRIETKPAQFGMQLKKIMALDPSVTVPDLANDLNVSTTWIQQRVSLHKLLPAIRERVDMGDISALKAFALAKLPEEEQMNYVERAVTEPVDKFVETCNTRAKEIRDATRSGKKAGSEKFVPVARVRSAKAIKEEYSNKTERAKLVAKGMDPLEAFDAAIQWVLHLDPETVGAEKKAWEEQKIAREQRSKERAARRVDAKAAKARQAEEEARKALSE